MRSTMLVRVALILCENKRSSDLSLAQAVAIDPKYAKAYFRYVK